VWRALLRRYLPAALLTCVVAVYNGFPLAYPDTGNYVQNAYDVVSGREPWFFFRPLTYGLLLVPFANPYGFWLVPLAQGLVVAFVVDLSLRSADVRLPARGFVGLFAALSAFTSLPWFSGQVMPDILTSVVILLCFVMVWSGEQAKRPCRWMAGGLLALAVATHLSHFPLAAMLLVSGLVGRALVERGRCRIVPLALRAVAPLAVAVLLVAAPNYFLHGEPVLSRSSSLFALARLVGDSLAQPYLNRVCAVERYRLCAERAGLRADVDWFLWRAGGPRMRHEAELQRGDSTFLREAGAIVRGTLREELPGVVSTSLRKAVKQLAAFGIAPGEHSFSPTVEGALTQIGPGVRGAYMNSRQARDALPVEAATAVQYAGVAAGLLVLIAYLGTSRGRGRGALQALIATVCLGIVLNALVLASLARVHPRYQSRVIWLVPLVAVAAAVELRRRRLEGSRAAVTVAHASDRPAGGSPPPSA
jgi:hypothetical protein